MPRPIGIDFGTTYTVVAALEEGRPRIIPNAGGEHLTPSVVAFDGAGQPLVGRPATELASTDSGPAVFSIKRRLGSSFKVKAAGGDYTPQQIAGFILRKAKGDAERHLGEAIEQAVITVPAYFNDRQRQAIKEAGRLAGLEVVHLLSEPTSAALAYGIDREEAETILVWDLGGGTFDVSVLELDHGIFEVRAVSGDNWLGGDDFDERVVELLVAEYQGLTGTSLPEDGVTRRKLRVLAERTKVQLSQCPQVPVRFGDGRLPLQEATVSRAEVEHLTADLLERLVAPCIIFFDEIDALAAARGSGGDSSVAARVTAQLLTELDGIEELRGVTVVAATNRPDIVDPALLRSGRFDWQLELPAPEEQARRAIFLIHTRDTPLAEDVDLDGMAAATEGLAGSDIAALCQRASLLAIRAFLQANSPSMGSLRSSALRVADCHFAQALRELTRGRG